MVSLGLQHMNFGLGGGVNSDHNMAQGHKGQNHIHIVVSHFLTWREPIAPAICILRTVPRVTSLLDTQGSFLPLPYMWPVSQGCMEISVILRLYCWPWDISISCLKGRRTWVGGSWNYLFRYKYMASLNEMLWSQRASWNWQDTLKVSPMGLLELCPFSLLQLCLGKVTTRSSIWPSREKVSFSLVCPYTWFKIHLWGGKYCWGTCILPNKAE